MMCWAGLFVRSRQRLWPRYCVKRRIRRIIGYDSNESATVWGPCVYDAAAGGVVCGSLSCRTPGMDQKNQFPCQAGGDRRVIRSHRRAGHRDRHPCQRHNSECSKRRSTDGRLAVRRSGGHHRRRHRRRIPLVCCLLGRRRIQPAGMHPWHPCGRIDRCDLPEVYVRQQEGLLVLWSGYRHDHRGFAYAARVYHQYG